MQAGHEPHPEDYLHETTVNSRRAMMHKASLSTATDGREATAREEYSDKLLSLLIFLDRRGLGICREDLSQI